MNGNTCGSLGDIEYDREARHKIKLKLTEIQSITDLTSIGLQFERKEGGIDESELSVAEENVNIYENVSTLGIYVTNNYYFFSKLIVQDLKTGTVELNLSDAAPELLIHSNDEGQPSMINEYLSRCWDCSICNYSNAKNSANSAICGTCQCEPKQNVDNKVIKEDFQNKTKDPKEEELYSDSDSNYLTSKTDFSDSDLDSDGIYTVCGTDFGKTDFKREEKCEDGGNHIDTKNYKTSSVHHVMNEWKKINFSLDQKTISGDSNGNYVTSKKDTEASVTSLLTPKSKYPESYTIKSKSLKFDYDDKRKGIDKNKGFDELKVDSRAKSFDAESQAEKNEKINISNSSIGSHNIDSDKNCGFDSSFDVIDKSELNVGVQESGKRNSKCDLADFVNKWKCEKCTFNNDALVTFCKECGYKNPHLAKCTQCRYRTTNIQLRETLCSWCAYYMKTKEEDRIRLSERKPKEKETKDKLPMRSYKDYIVMDNEEKKQYDGTLQGKPLDDSGLVDQKRHGKYDVKARQLNSERFEKVGQNNIDENKAECPICGKCFDNRESPWCQTCEQNRWRCPDKDCRRINFVFSKYCFRCGTKKGSDLSNGRSFYKSINNIKIKLYQCEHCHISNDCNRVECVYCKRPRQLKIQCGKCHLLHDPREPCPKCDRYIGKVTTV